ncbi:MAG: ATP-binding cassette domain-containing protein [Candidatus Riflebacteria bacterium]|nr:ATP-binding cassette domain-containing protein [Candidatus Riflebacteria bacterium]
MEQAPLLPRQPKAQAEARGVVRAAAERAKGRPGILAYSIGNEISPSIIRWHGTRRVERFLAELADVVRQTDPEALVTYGNYPSTEYLDLPFVDFYTFNVYLHDRETFRRYLVHLLNLAGEKPLVLGELGMDTLRHGEDEQARFLTGHTKEAALLGTAGTYVFSWTDDWYTGGTQIQDWAFGITDRHRSPRASYHRLGELHGSAAARLLERPTRVSVVVCSHNGGPTLEQCLSSLTALDYPSFELIVVDDGSTDNTREICARFPGVRAIHQSNQGLSTARNVGLAASTGSVVAYTDSDCFVDSQWLTHLVHQLERTGAAGVGGPNLTPRDGWVAACVAVSPGQPTHVLETEELAEHIPGCNMAFRREVLEAVGGFDARFRAAGDDVDVCWRVQEAGHRIVFAPGAFVWHHRRHTAAAYLAQQSGYGRAEALLRFKHPDRFNRLGAGKWRGVVYGASQAPSVSGEPVVFRGRLGAGLFQCVYQQGPQHWMMLPSTLEWHFGIAMLALWGLAWPGAWSAAAAAWLLSLAVAGLQAVQAPLEPKHDSLAARVLIAALSYAQPLARSFSRYKTSYWERGVPQAPARRGERPRLPLTGKQTVAYWSERGRERVELLETVAARLTERRWTVLVDEGWSTWGLAIRGHPWTTIRVRSVQEDFEHGKKLVRVLYELHPNASFRLLFFCALLTSSFGLVAPGHTLEVESLSMVHEALAMLRVIVAFGREDHEQRRFRAQAEDAVKARVELMFKQALFSLTINSTTALGTALILAYGSHLVLGGRMTVGELTVVLAYIAQIYNPLQRISNIVASLQELRISLERTFGLLEAQPRIMDRPDAVDLGTVRGALAFEGVGFDYPGRERTLEEVSFVVKPGQVVAIVGPTGAGKTTLASLLPRFYEAARGRILVDGLDTRRHTMRSLRAQISVVLQEPLLFSTSVAENIRYGRLDASFDEIVEAAKAANAHEFIATLPGQYETVLGERGARLSGGERQRISLARAFLKGAPILILDEPTASVDVRTESVILDALDRLMAGRTTLIIAHRLSTIRSADLVLVLDRGRLVQQGSPEALLGRNGLFKQLHDLQNAGPGREVPTAMEVQALGVPA